MISLGLGQTSSTRSVEYFINRWLNKLMNDAQEQTKRRYFRPLIQMVGITSQNVTFDATRLDRLNQDYTPPSVAKRFRPISIARLFKSPTRSDVELKHSRELIWSMTRLKTPTTFLMARINRPSVRARLAGYIRWYFRA